MGIPMGGVSIFCTVDRMLSQNVDGVKEWVGDERGSKDYLRGFHY